MNFRNKLVFVHGKPFQPSPMLWGKAGAYLSQVFYSRVGSWPHSQTLDQGRKGQPGTNTSFLQKFVNYGRKKFYMIGPRLDLKLCSILKNVKIESRGQFVEQKLGPSTSFRCDQIQNCHRYYFGHTLLCCLSRAQMFNKPTSVKLKESQWPYLQHFIFLMIPITWSATLQFAGKACRRQTLQLIEPSHKLHIK